MLVCHAITNCIALHVYVGPHAGVQHVWGDLRKIAIELQDKRKLMKYLIPNSRGFVNWIPFSEWVPAIRFCFENILKGTRTAAQKQILHAMLALEARLPAHARAVSTASIAGSVLGHELNVCGADVSDDDKISVYSSATPFVKAPNAVQPVCEAHAHEQSHVPTSFARTEPASERLRKRSQAYAHVTVSPHKRVRKASPVDVSCWMPIVSRLAFSTRGPPARTSPQNRLNARVLRRFIHSILLTANSASHKAQDFSDAPELPVPVRGLFDACGVKKAQQLFDDMTLLQLTMFGCAPQPSQSALQLPSSVIAVLETAVKRLLTTASEFYRNWLISDARIDSVVLLLLERATIAHSESAASATAPTHSVQLRLATVMDLLHSFVVLAIKHAVEEEVTLRNTTKTQLATMLECL